MASYPKGFSYVKGTFQLYTSAMSSTATFKGGNPLIPVLGYTVDQPASSVVTQIVGIAQHDAANSIRAGYVSIQRLFPDTVFATQVQTGVAASALSAGLVYGIEKSGNYFRLDTDSKTTPVLVIVPRDDGSTIDSADSSVWVQFLGQIIGPFTSSTSTTF